MKTKKPLCMHCEKKPARKLNLPGEYGEHAFFCSLRCAAKRGLNPPMYNGYCWCQKHSEWFSIGDGCDSCYSEAVEARRAEREAEEREADENHSNNESEARQ